MTEHVIATTTPRIPFWRRRLFVVPALVALLALGVGTAIGMLLASESSVTYRSASAPAAQSTRPEVAIACGAGGSWDGTYLLGAVASMSDDVALQVTASLSPQAQRAMSEAALTGVFVPNYAPPTPDAPTLAGALARLGAPDRQLVITGLAPRLRAEVESSLDAVAAFASCS